MSLRSDGVESGTVYCGGKTAAARMVVYDKRHERASRKLPDTGDLTRFADTWERKPGRPAKV